MWIVNEASHGVSLRQNWFACQRNLKSQGKRGYISTHGRLKRSFETRDTNAQRKTIFNWKIDFLERSKARWVD